MIAQSLSKRRIAITGSTGFVGTALVERLPRGVPDCELIPSRSLRRAPLLLVERREKFLPTMPSTACGKSTPPLTSRLTTCARRITTIAGDVSADGLGLSDEDRMIFSTADTIIHSAATVSFDSPLDQAVEINLLGPVRIAQLCNDLGITPHLVAVSTCYVAGNRRGTAPEELVSEGPFAIGLEWKDEVAVCPAAQRRYRGLITPARTPQRVSQTSPKRTWCRWRSRSCCKNRTAARTLGARSVGRRRPFTCGLGRLA